MPTTLTRHAATDRPGLIEQAWAASAPPVAVTDTSHDWLATRTFPCPTCQAPTGRPCRSAQWRKRQFSHRSRQRGAAVALGPCPPVPASFVAWLRYDSAEHDEAWALFWSVVICLRDGHMPHTAATVEDVIEHLLTCPDPPYVGPGVPDRTAAALASLAASLPLYAADLARWSAHA